QVCRTRASKRVHHIANLTTALTVLRRRGLELVNNNASDIADGNPRIVLGLIWQIILHFQMYFRVRREFIEYRSLYNTIMATKLNYTIEELSLIQERWEIIRNNLEATAVNAEKRLPKPYSSLSVWTATGQSIINTPLNLPTENPQKCLVILQKMISEHN
ncbi:hypothetical protein OSTOST_22410, partial [Ostertagia ostertagi]